MDPLHPCDDGLEILEVDEEESPPSTPVPSLTIGRVLDLISKAKQGNINQVKILLQLKYFLCFSDNPQH